MYIGTGAIGGNITLMYNEILCTACNDILPLQFMSAEKLYFFRCFSSEEDIILGLNFYRLVEKYD